MHAIVPADPERGLHPGVLFTLRNREDGVKEESDIDSLFTPGGTSALVDSIRGLDDFELIAFLVIMKDEG